MQKAKEKAGTEVPALLNALIIR